MTTNEETILNDVLLKQRVATGVIFMGFRRVVLQFLITLTNVVLARILLPEIFGVYGIISFLILTFGLVANFGMGPSIVQKKSQPTSSELQAIFTLLMVASILFIGLVFILAPVIDYWYKGHLGETGVMWLRIFSLSVILDHIATISMHLLQRKLEFQKFTFGEIITTIITQTITVLLILEGWGLGGLVLGNLLGKVCAIIIFFWFHPWPIGLNFSFKNIRLFLPFGLNFQANNLINSLNGAVVPLVVGTIVGPKAVGFVNWAGGIRSAGMAPFDVVEKLIFSSVSRKQDDKKFLKILIEKMLKFSCLFSFPLIALIGALAPFIIKLIYTDKWIGGLTTLYLSLIQGVFLLQSIFFTDILFALGKSATVRNISIFWALFQWILTFPFIYFFGFNGVVIAGIAVSATFFLPFMQVNKFVNIRFWPNVLPYLIYSIASGIFVHFLTTRFEIHSVSQLLFFGGVGGIVYIGLLSVFEQKTLYKDFLKLKHLILSA